MANASSTRSLTSAFKRLKLSPSTPAARHQVRHIQQSSQHAAPAPTRPMAAQVSSQSVEQELANLRLPKAVQATYLAPLKRAIPENATNSAELHLRSYSVRNLEVFADFALRAAYFLNLPATGPKPLRRIIQRWTLPKSNFVHKKSQEAFERITMQRLIEIKGGHPKTVAIWLAFLRKHQYYGVGMKAHVYDYGSVQTAKNLDAEANKIAKRMDTKYVVFRTHANKSRSKRPGPIFKEPFKGQWGARAAMGGAPSVPGADRILDYQKIRQAQEQALEPKEGSE
ncbi:hypothetical protein PRZ48_006876 [Zasmidium cellare]|uniref:Small ribosomal subunit protein uS10 domain-containing protein n=1 Tax=Zasmidium cellare TaxID=395010 RepID=A0ABR0EIM4_ZASCE|nr:hypothetical protein PRZ48_006876 [Zasmidium cellare]